VCKESRFGPFFQKRWTDFILRGQNHVDEVPDGATPEGLRLFEPALRHKIQQVSVLEFE
jgi:hypothetical protein